MRCELETPVTITAVVPHSVGLTAVNGGIFSKWCIPIVMYTSLKINKICQEFKIGHKGNNSHLIIKIEYGGRNAGFEFYQHNNILEIVILDSDLKDFGRFKFIKGKIPKFKSMITSRIKQIKNSLQERQVADVINS
jgi:hypothetical protein